MDDISGLKAYRVERDKINRWGLRVSWAILIATAALTLWEVLRG